MSERLPAVSRSWLSLPLPQMFEKEKGKKVEKEVKS